MAAIVVEGLRKDYGAVHAVSDVSFTVADGEVFALVGPNGAGKTTTVEILEGFRYPTAGSVRVLGVDPGVGGRDLRERIGIVLQEAGFDEDFTVDELVRLFAGMYPRRFRADDVIAMVGLADKHHARAKTLSGGQRRRLDLALALVGDPQLLFLDEPTTGFDPEARRRAWELVDGLRDLGKTVLLTTHYLDEAEHLADRLAVLVDGRIVATGSPAEITRAATSGSVLTFRLPHGVGLDDVPDLGGPLTSRGLDWQLRTDRPTAALHRLTDWADRRGTELAGLTVTQPSLEDAYLELVGAGPATDPSSEPALPSTRGGRR